MAGEARTMGISSVETGVQTGEAGARELTPIVHSTTTRAGLEG